jgi:hypothetical protein
MGTKSSQREEQFLQLWNECVTGVGDPVREYVFAPPRRWRFDFYWPDFKVAVEIEGGTFGGGRHGSGFGHHLDCDKYNRAAVMGIKVLRFTTKHIKEKPGDVIEMLADAMGAPVVAEKW